MTNCFVLAEGARDVKLLSALLGDVVASGEAKIVEAGGRSSAVSLARSLLAKRSAAVALVWDADATDSDRVAELRTELEDSLAAVAPRTRFRVLLAVPALEACLFQDEAGLQDVFGDALSTDQLVRSRYEPKAVIEQLFRARNESYDTAAQATLLDKLNLNKLRTAPVIRELTDFLSHVKHPTPA